MKKSIVMLISLLFITAISALLLQNLNDTQSYITSQNYKINKVQLMALVKNAQKEASAVIKKYPDDLPDLENVPLDIEGNEILFTLKEYDRKNVNLLKEKNSKKYKNIEDLFFDNNIGDFDNFRYFFSSGQTVKNNKQLDNIIDNFVKETYNKNIQNIRNQLGFLDTKDKLYELYLYVKNLGDFVNAYYVLDKEGKVKYFELGFK